MILLILRVQFKKMRRKFYTSAVPALSRSALSAIKWIPDKCLQIALKYSMMAAIQSSS